MGENRGPAVGWKLCGLAGGSMGGYFALGVGEELVVRNAPPVCPSLSYLWLCYASFFLKKKKKNAFLFKDTIFNIYCSLTLNSMADSTITHARMKLI